jgi:hypothetical protein
MSNRSGSVVRRGEAMYRREPNVGTIAFSRSDDPNVGECEEFERRDAHVTRCKGEYSKCRLDREFPYQVMLPAERFRGFLQESDARPPVSLGTASPMRRTPIALERSSATKHSIHALRDAARASTCCAVQASTENVGGHA